MDKILVAKVSIASLPIIYAVILVKTSLNKISTPGRLKSIVSEIVQL